MYKTFFRTLLCVVTLTIGAAWLRAGDLNDDLKLLESEKGNNASKPAAKFGPSATTAKDPVELALAIPRKFHIKYDDLRQDQKKAYDAMKKRYGPKLKDAIQKVKDTAEADKAKAAKEVRSLRHEVSQRIIAILSQPDPTAKLARPRVQNRRYGRYYY